ncbi:Disintegrin and metalloproteinase domain-containing protein 9 [Liparis tanakae]|uniref:Disintegrin and metalloproteinase domain-containing protein 9 n=1 Tax=Liparis tanakae TaxID=230148 RepID=A0A4Z2J1C4_9TELE|nr:Disintegrin and metalloproteinase domain-containing protein 9 [Liparis tanakae]
MMRKYILFAIVLLSCVSGIDNIDSFNGRTSKLSKYSIVHCYYHGEVEGYEDSVRKRNLPQTSYVELVLVVDQLRYIHNKENETAVREEMVQLANLLDGYYKQLNIRVVLVGLEIFKESNPFNVEGSAKKVLGDFVKWRKTSLLPKIRHDIAQLIVGLPEPYETNILGMAFVGTVCHVANAGGINVFSGDTKLPYFSTVVAHEMGHNLGMNHDTDGCSCNGEDSCIMASVSGGAPLFSGCSGTYFENLIIRGGGTCLKNQPSSTDVVDVAECGNGRLDKGEQCDCGKPEECNNKCCDAATCKFTSGSVCSQGECCDNCQIKVSGAPCRESVNTCDLTEYCNGTTEFCPNDFYVMDGLPCEDNQAAAYCYEGQCQTYDFQCRNLFKPDVLDPGYVNSGSPCDKGKTCLDFKCENASALLPNLDCDAQKCNNNGICNDQGNCHCDNGWAPPNCDRSGSGGSINSGRAQIDHSLRNGLLIFFLLVVPVLIIVILALLYIFKRDSLKPCLKRRRTKSSNPTTGNADRKANGNVQRSATTQPPSQATFDGPGYPPATEVPISEYGDMDYWNAEENASSVQPPAPRQGPGVPRPIPPKQPTH